ncbi:MAG: DUF3408 domain-containing protein [Prevotellaceae bacterium]|jgi:hypothetical protein|nr:DUF3408 domain-containing protein [Prevotellaceae bacterium]
MKKKELSQRVNEYQSLFIKESDSEPARYGKSVYVRKKHHERIFQIISIIGSRKVTLYDYIDNV